MREKRHVSHANGPANDERSSGERRAATTLLVLGLREKREREREREREKDERGEECERVPTSLITFWQVRQS